jgi:hypothetical protein
MVPERARRVREINNAAVEDGGVASRAVAGELPKDVVGDGGVTGGAIVHELHRGDTAKDTDALDGGAAGGAVVGEYQCAAVDDGNGGTASVDDDAGAVKSQR